MAVVVRREVILRAQPLHGAIFEVSLRQAILLSPSSKWLTTGLPPTWEQLSEIAARSVVNIEIAIEMNLKSSPHNRIDLLQLPQVLS